MVVPHMGHMGGSGLGLSAHADLNRGNRGGFFICKIPSGDHAG